MNQDSGIREVFAPGIWTPGLWNPESKFHWQVIRNPVPRIWNLHYGIQNPWLSWITCTLHGRDNTSMRNEIIRSKTQSVSEMLVLCNIPHCIHCRILYSVPMFTLYQRAFHANTKSYAVCYYEHLSDLWLSSAALLRYKNRADGNQRFYLRTEALFGVVLVPAQKVSSRAWTKP